MWLTYNTDKLSINMQNENTWYGIILTVFVKNFVPFKWELLWKPMALSKTDFQSKSGNQYERPTFILEHQHWALTALGPSKVSILRHSWDHVFRKFWWQKNLACAWPQSKGICFTLVLKWQRNPYQRPALESWSFPFQILHWLSMYKSHRLC